MLRDVRRDAEHGTRDACAPRGFSLIEILVTVAILTVIILGLVAMFNQTRRAFTSSMTQVDVLQAGRTAADMIAREIEQLTPSFAGGICNFQVRTASGYPTLVQPLSDPTDLKTNDLQAVYFITLNNRQWTCIGYKLAISDYQAGIGTLYRFSAYNINYTNNNVLSNEFLGFIALDPPNTNYAGAIPGASFNYNRLIDGVVDFRFRVFDGNGVQITNGNTSGSIFIQTNGIGPTGDFPIQQFANDAVPASVELELGVLEDRTLAKYQALTNAGVGPGSIAWSYLTNHAAQVHIFRQRIPIRNVNPAAYQ